MVKYSDIIYLFELGLVSRTQKAHVPISKKKAENSIQVVKR